MQSWPPVVVPVGIGARRMTTTPPLPWIIVAALLMSLLALANGYPFVFDDSGTYVSQAIKFEGGLSRPPFYSFFLLVLHLRQSLWPIPVAQNLIVTWLLFLLLALLWPTLSSARIFAVVMLTALLTYLPWVANQVMPDVYTPLVLVLVFLLVFAWDHLSRLERLVFPPLLAMMVAFHQAHGPFALGLLAAALAFGWWYRYGRVWLLRGTVVVVMPVLLALAGQSFYGYWEIGRWTPSPAAPFFLLARLVYDGPAKQYLDEVCPGAGFFLCSQRDRFVNDSNWFLWTKASPLETMIRNVAEARALDEASAIVAGTLRTHPGAVLASVFTNTLDQLMMFGTVNLGCNSCLGGKIDTTIHDFFPHEYGQFLNSRQISGRWPLAAISAGHVAIVLAAIGALMLNRHKLDDEPRRFLFLLLWALLLNAILMGGLSIPAHRYGARLTWLLPMLAAALLMAGGVRTHQRTVEITAAAL